MTAALTHQARRIWVLMEQEEGAPHPVSWELLGAARRLAAELDAEQAVVEGVLLGHDVGAIAKEAFRYGASRVYLIDDPVLAVYRNLPYAAGVYRLDRQGRVMVGYQACVECGSCRVGCPFLNIGWALPRGGYGVAYKFG